jgi:hypothetical protein
MRVRPAFRWIAIASAVLLVPIVMHRIWDYVELRRLIGEIEAIRARKEPVTAPTRRPKPGEPQQAGRTYVAAAMLNGSAPPEVRWLIDGVHEWLAGARAEKPTSALAEVLERSTDALRLADRAGTLNFAGFAPGMDYSYGMGELHSLALVISARSLHLALGAESDAAVDSAVSVMMLQRAMGDRYWVRAIGPLHETAAILSLSQPDPGALGRLQRALEADERPQRAIDIMLGERARFVEEWWRRYYGPSPEATSRYTLPMRSVGETVLRPFVTHRFVRTLQAWAELLDAARVPWPGFADRMAAMTSKYDVEHDGLGLMWYARFSHPVVAYEIFKRAVMPDELIVNRSSRAAIAVERFRRARQGAMPATLQALVPDFLTSVPQDPITGGPLLFKQDAGAYTIYSVGPDLKDDGGDLNSELLKVIKQGYGRRIVAGADIGVRVVVR